MDATSALARFQEFNLDPALAQAVEDAPDERVIEGILRVEDPARIPEGFIVVSRFNRICTGRFRAADTWNIRRDPNAQSLKAARPLGVEDRGASRDAIASPATAALSRARSGAGGRGCVVAALDFGVDFAHPNFLNSDGTTRIAGFWHQGARYDPQHPNTFGYGRVYSRAQIDAALRTPDPYRALNYHPAISDSGSGSHGTHTLDIAAGTGRAPGARPGGAPKADLMFVHLSTPRLGATGDLGDSVRLLEGLDYVERTARGRPWVANLSVGRTAGSHDGTSLVEQGMHELLRFGPGRAIVQSAGNYRAADLAVAGRLRDGEDRDLSWIVDPRDTTVNEIDIWYAGKDRFVIEVCAPGEPKFVAVKLGDVSDIEQGGRVVGRIYHRRRDPNNADNQVELFLFRGAPPGTWTVRLTGEYVINGRFHAWIERDLARPGAQSRFDRKVSSRSYTLGTIATSPLVITVGAYDANAENKPLAPFSSCGPTRDERHDKPELLAPGVDVVAARSIPRGSRRQEGLLIARSGTSMAAPHVAGCVAGMFDAAGRPVSIDEIRDCLKRSAEPVANAEHTHCSGWGRLDTARAIREIRRAPRRSLSAVRPAATEQQAAIFDSIDPEVAAAYPSSALEQQDTESSSEEGQPMNSNRADAFLKRADRAALSSTGDRRRSEASFLQKLLVGVGADLDTVLQSPADLFRAALRNGAAMQHIGSALEVLGIPLQQLSGGPRAGDWLVRTVPGIGDVGHLSILASDALITPSALVSGGIASEAARPGYYALVIESGATPHTRSARFARRVLDARGRVPPHTLILRPTSLEADFEESAAIEAGGSTSTRSSIKRDIPIEFFRLKFDEFVTRRKQALVTIRIHDNRLKVTFAQDLASAHGLKPYEKNLGHLEVKRRFMPDPDITIKDLNSNRVTADAEIVNESSTRSGKTMALRLSIGFETKGTEIEVNNFGDVDLQEFVIHVEFALIRGILNGRGAIDFRPRVKVDVKATMNNWFDSTGREGVRSAVEREIGKALRDPDLHKKFSRALTRWLVGGDWEVQDVDVLGTHLRITYVEPPRDEFVQLFPEKPQKRLTIGNLSKIDHIVVLMMENRSFDHMLGYLKLTGAKPNVDGLTGKETNTYKGKTFRPFHLTGTVFPRDPCHDRDCVQTQIGANKMDGFVENFAAHLKGQGNPGDVMGYHDGKDLPVYDVLAREFAVCDRWFSSHPGPTFSNRFYALTGRLGVSQFGEHVYRNPDFVTYAPSQTKTIFDHLDDRNVTWRYYEHGYCFVRLFHRWVYDVQQIRPAADFFAAAAAGKLPSVCFIDPDFIEMGTTSNDDHAPANVRDGQRLIGRIVNALMNGPAWSKTLFLLTYDEHGGFYDHVVPPPAPNVSGVNEYGVRVPAFVVSPWVERGSVVKTPFDHTSILKTIVRRFCAANPPDLGERVTAAADVGSLLSRARPRADKPAIQLPAPSPTAPKEAIEAVVDSTSLRSFRKLLAATRERYAQTLSRAPTPSQTPTAPRPARTAGART
jgi:phospholipase C/subtilisin family serine protease